MSHNDKTWWHSFTYMGMRDGQFLLAPNRDPNLAIDPNMETIASYKAAKAELDALRKQNADEADVKREGLDRQVKKLKADLAQKEIDLQAATARASNVDAAVRAEVAMVETKLNEAHKAALTELQTACDTAHEGEMISFELKAAGELATMRSERDIAQNELEAKTRLVAERDGEIDILIKAAEKRDLRITELEAKVVAIGDELTAMTAAKGKAEDEAKETKRQAESQRVELEMTQSELKRVAEEFKKLQGDHNGLKREFLLLGRGNLSSGVRIGLLEARLDWYGHAFGPIPSDVNEQILTGLPVVPESVKIEAPPPPETKVKDAVVAPIETLSPPETKAEVVADDPKNGTEVATATEAPSEDPPDIVDTDEDNPFADDDDPIDIDNVVGETQAISTGSVEFIHEASELVPPDDLPTCDSPTDCEKIATWRTQHPFVRNDGEAPLHVLTCDDHHEHCEVFVDPLQAFVESPPADADALRALLVPIHPIHTNPITTQNPVEAP